MTVGGERGVFMKKYMVLLLVLCGICFVGCSDTGVIGGADGPTSIVVSE